MRLPCDRSRVLINDHVSLRLQKLESAGLVQDYAACNALSAVSCMFASISSTRRSPGYFAGQVQVSANLCQLQSSIRSLLAQQWMALADFWSITLPAAALMLPGVRGGKRTGNCPKVSASASASSDICLWKRTISRGNRPDCLLSAVLRSGPRSWNTTGCSINLRALASESQEVKQSIDLLHNIPKGDHWGTIEQWIVFSDLHVDKKSSKVIISALG